MTVDFRGIAEELRQYPKDGQLQLVDLVVLPEPVRTLLTWMIRRGSFNSEEVAEFCGIPPEAAREVIEVLMERGFLAADDHYAPNSRYRIRAQRTPARTIRRDLF